MANVGVTSAQDGVLTQHPVVVPEMSSFEDVRQAIANVFATFQQSLHSQFPLTNFQGKRITNVAPPTSADDVVTLKYLQSNQPSQQNKTINPFQANSGSGGSNLWTQAGAALYPTATFTTFVLVGANNTDLSIGAGTVVANSGTGSGFVVINAQTNASVFQMTIFGGLCSFLSNKTGTGTVVSMTFNFAGTEVMRIHTSGVVLVGFTSGGDYVPTTGRIVASVDLIVATATTNSAFMRMIFLSSVAYMDIGTTGTGTILPFGFRMNGTEMSRLRTGGSWLFGLTSSDVGDNKGWIVEQGVFGIVNASTNANALFLSVNGTTETIIHSSFSGAGTALPLSLYLSGVRYFTLLTSGALIGGAFTTDISPTAGMIILTSAYFLISATTNASTFEIHAGSGVFEFISSSSGTGSIVPVRFSMGGTEVARFLTTGELLIGLTSSDASNNLGNLYISNFFGILSATTNATALFLSINGTTETVIHSSFSGTGTVKPLSFYVNGTRMMTITVAGLTLLGLLSSDFSAAAPFSLFTTNVVGCLTAATNATYIYISANTGSSQCQIVSGRTGTGTFFPLVFYVPNEAARITTNGTFLVGLTSTDAATGTGDLYIGNFFGILSATTNATALFLSINGTTETVIHSSFSGTGAVKPMSFYVNGTRMWTIDTSGVLIGRNVSNGSYGAINGRILTVGDFIQTTGYTANESYIRMEIASSLGTIESGAIGTGTILPLTFNVGTGTEVARCATTLAFLVGGTSSDAFNSAGEIASIGANSAVGAASATANASFIYLFCGGSPSVVTISSGHSGTGATKPIAINSFGTEQARWDLTGRYLVGLTSSDSGGAGSIIASFTVQVCSATANSHAIAMSVNGTTETVLHSTFSGTGTSLPLSLYVNGIRGMSLLVTNPVKVLIGSITDDGSGALLQVHGNISVNGTVLTVP